MKSHTLHTLCALWLLVGVALANTPNTNPPVMPIGSKVPDFALPGIDGKTYRLADFAAAKVLCLIFTSNHCPESVAARPRIQRLQDDFKDRGVALVAINTNNPAGLRPDELGHSPYGDSFEEMKPFASEGKWTLPYLYDGEDHALGRACGAQSTPHVFVFDAERTLRYTGRLDEIKRVPDPNAREQVREAIEALLAGKTIAEPVTRSFGCSTKWKWKAEAVAQDELAWRQKPVGLETLDEASATMLRANKSGNVRLLHVWSTTCGECVIEFPDIVDTYRRFQNRPFDMATISLDALDKSDSVKKFLQSQHAAISDRSLPAFEKEGRKSLNYHYGDKQLDALAEILDPEWSGAMPHSILIGRDGKKAWSHTGKVDPVELRRAILQALEAP